MFNWASVANEVADAMERFQAEAAYDEDSVNEQKRLKALSYLNEAAEAFDIADYKAQAEKLTTLIEKLGQGFEEEKPGIEEREKLEEPIEEQSFEEEPDEQSNVESALNVLRHYHSKTEEGRPEAMKEYIPGMVYLRTVMQGVPRPQIFNKFDLQTVPQWVANIAQLSPEELTQSVAYHLNETGRSIGELDATTNAFLQDLPATELTTPMQTGEETGEEKEEVELSLKNLPEIIEMNEREVDIWNRYEQGERLSEDEQVILNRLQGQGANALVNKVMRLTPLPELVALDPAERHIWDLKQKGQEIDDIQQSILDKKQREARNSILKELGRLEFRRKEQREKRQERESRMEEYAPSAVRRIDPQTGRVVQEIPVELGRGRRGPRWQTVKERRQKEEAPKEERTFAGARVYPEGRFWMVELPGETRARRFRDREQAIAFAQNKVGEGNVQISRASKFDLIEKLADQFKCVVKNPGKTKEEKEVYKHYGYGDDNDAVDKNIPIEEIKPAEEFWEDE